MLCGYLRPVFWFYFSLVLLLASFIFRGTITYYFDFSDLTSRLLMNGAYVTEFYYLWTVSWWVPMILLLLLYTYMLRFDNWGVNGYTLFLFNTGMSILSIFLFYWAVNSIDYALVDNSTSYNLLLTNTLNQYHPNLFLVLITSIYSLLFVHWLLLTTPSYNYYNTWLLHLINSCMPQLVLLSCITTTLGSWWAFQEGSWGGWWNWDLSEYLSLILIWLFTYIFHLWYHRSQLINYSNDMLGLLSITLCIYLFVQYYLTKSSHSFGQEFTRGSILNRHQQLILLTCLIIALLTYKVNKTLKTLYSFILTLQGDWGPYVRLTPYYKIWALVLVYTLSWVTIRTLSRSTTTLLHFGGLSMVTYVIPWRQQLDVFLILFIIYYWVWELPILLTLSYYIYGSQTILLIYLGQYRFGATKTLNHLFWYGALLVNLVYTIYVVLIPSTSWGLLNYLNFSLEVEYRLLTSTVIDSNIVQLNSLTSRLNFTNYTSTLLLELTAGDTNEYNFYLSPNLTEQRWVLTNLYSYWFGYELDFSTLLLSTLIWVSLVYIYSYTSRYSYLHI